MYIIYGIYGTNTCSDWECFKWVERIVPLLHMTWWNFNIVGNTLEGKVPKKREKRSTQQYNRQCLSILKFSSLPVAIWHIRATRDSIKWLCISFEISKEDLWWSHT